MDHEISSLNYSNSLNREQFSGLVIIKVIEGIVKRTFDMLLSAGGLIILSPLFVYIVRRLKIDSPGPVFYWGPRAGLGGKTFKMLKFRTMYERPESYRGARVTCKGDDRITPFGHWLRDTKINELPQLWNVLIGDMSLVGPRPEDVEIAANWPEDAKQEILSVRPGITSPASVLYHDEEDLLSTSNVMGDYFKSILPDKMRLDRLYVRNHSFIADLDVIFWTIAILLPRVVKRRVPEGYLFAGPLSRLMYRYVSWFLVDLFVAFGASVTAVLIWRIQAPLNWGTDHLIIYSILLAVMFGGFNTFAGLKRIVWSDAYAEDAAGLLVSAGLATLVTTGVNYLQSVYRWLPHPGLPMTMIYTTGLMASIGFIVVRYRFRLLTGFASRWLNWRSQKGVMERVMIVGSGEGSQVANWLLRRGDASRIFLIVGIVDDELPAMQGMQVKGLRILGGLKDIPALIKRYDVGVVLYAIPRSDIEVQEKVSTFCLEANIRMIHLCELLHTLQQQLTQPAGRTRVSVQTVQSKV